MSDFDRIVVAFKDFALKAIENGVTDAEQAKEYMYKLNNNFRWDSMFQDVFPVCFGLVMCDIKLAKENSSEAGIATEAKMEEVD